MRGVTLAKCVDFCRNAGVAAGRIDWVSYLHQLITNSKVKRDQIEHEKSLKTAYWVNGVNSIARGLVHHGEII